MFTRAISDWFDITEPDMIYPPSGGQLVIQTGNITVSTTKKAKKIIYYYELTGVNYTQLRVLDVDRNTTRQFIIWEGNIYRSEKLNYLAATVTDNSITFVEDVGTATGFGYVAAWY